MDTCLLQIILLNNKNDLFVQKIIHGDFYAGIAVRIVVNHFYLLHNNVLIR